MAQVGRISGPLLTANLERNGIDLAFRNDLDTTQLLYFDVRTGKVGVNRNAPLTELNIEGLTRTVDLLGTTANIANFSIENNDIDVSTGDIFFNANRVINVSTLRNAEIQINDNTISSYNTNSNIDLSPNGVGTIEFLSNTNVSGNVHATGNITSDGSITIGNADTDNLILAGEFASDIIPDQDDTFSLGSSSKRWQNLYTNLLNGQAISTSGFVVGGVDVANRQGNTFWVAQNGDDTNVGDHPNGPFKTLKHALSQVDASSGGPVTIHVMPGGYEEELPLVVPSNVTIRGEDMRNVIIRPSSADQSKDIFHLNGETTIQNITIKDFFYDSGNDTGYAFRFAPSTVVTTRSPYIQNVSVITQGTATSASDPRGFASGDAGKGALVDGADVLSASNDASMLFHSCTFITPGVDAITMTNGVRVEWLNSFTYFANRGLYAVNGATGHLSPDGSTIKYGAEIRSIGSANVYGNYGAVADGADCLMYLIMHNFGYIGTGKFFANDPSRVIQSQEVLELNSGRVYYNSIDHLGNFKVGNIFFVDQVTGETSLVLTEAEIDSFAGLTITTAGQTTNINGSFIDIGNFRLQYNTISTSTGNIEIDSANEINFLTNTNITNDLDLTGNLSFGGSLNTIGDQITDTVDFNVDFDQDFAPGTTATYSLGSSSKVWKDFIGSEGNIGTVRFFDNVITTNDSNADLELRANGTGIIYLQDEDLIINNNLQVNGLTTLSNITSSGLATAGQFNFQSNFSTTNLTVNQNLNVAGTSQFEEIQIEDNFITTTSSNTDLELRASGTGNVFIPSEDFTIQNNLNIVGSWLSSDMFATQVQADKFTNSSILIEDNVIKTVVSNADLELGASGSGSVYLQNLEFTGNSISTTARIDSSLTDIDLDVNDSLTITGAGAVKLPTGPNLVITQGNLRFNSDLTAFEGFSTAKTYLNGVYSDDFATGLDAHPTNNTLFFKTDSTQRVYFDSTGLFAQKITVDDISIDNLQIRTTQSNSDLELVADGTGNIVIDNITIDGSKILNTVTDEITSLSNTDDGYWKFAGPGAILMPPGTELERPSSPEVGFTRINTDNGEMESWTGTAWITSAGEFENVTVADMEDEALIQSLIYG